MRLYGLIGYPLTHSFSQKYFTEKFELEQLTDATYRNFPLERIEEAEHLFNDPDLRGFNVTIPYKETIIPFLDEVDETANAVGAVNTVAVKRNAVGKIEKKIGYNTDVFGFGESLKSFLAKAPRTQSIKALILGTGGSAKAVAAALKRLGIKHTFVSRRVKQDAIIYETLKPQTILEHKLIINATPAGMHPDTNNSPAIPYSFITAEHLLYDLVYNPEETVFLKKGKEQGAQTKNGLEMLHLQAEESWKIWNS